MEERYFMPLIRREGNEDFESVWSYCVRVDLPWMYGASSEDAVECAKDIIDVLSSKSNDDFNIGDVIEYGSKDVTHLVKDGFFEGRRLVTYGEVDKEMIEMGFVLRD